MLGVLAVLVVSSGASASEDRVEELKSLLKDSYRKINRLAVSAKIRAKSQNGLSPFASRNVLAPEPLPPGRATRPNLDSIRWSRSRGRSSFSNTGWIDVWDGEKWLSKNDAFGAKTARAVADYGSLPHSNYDPITCGYFIRIQRTDFSLLEILEQKSTKTKILDDHRIEITASNLGDGQKAEFRCIADTSRGGLITNSLISIQTAQSTKATIHADSTILIGASTNVSGVWLPTRIVKVSVWRGLKSAPAQTTFEVSDIRGEADESDFQAIDKGDTVDFNGRIYIVGENGRWEEPPAPSAPGTLDPTNLGIVAVLIVTGTLVAKFVMGRKR